MRVLEGKDVVLTYSVALANASLSLLARNHRIAAPGLVFRGGSSWNL